MGHDDKRRNQGPRGPQGPPEDPYDPYYYTPRPLNGALGHDPPQTPSGPPSARYHERTNRPYYEPVADAAAQRFEAQSRLIGQQQSQLISQEEQLKNQSMKASTYKFDRRNPRGGNQANAPTHRGAGRRYASHASCVRLVHRENIPTLPASDWSAVRISPRFQRLIGPSREYT
eukprot:1183346-Prorocentrum_minimum.AAC.3